MHGGMSVKELGAPSLDALERGVPNLEKHVENMQSFGLPVVVALNAFPTDTEEELAFIRDKLSKLGVPVVQSDIWARGGDGGLDMARAVVEACDKPNTFHHLYDVNETPENKIRAIATKIYGAAGVTFTDKAVKDLKQIHDLGYDNLLICMAKTQASLSDDPNKKGRPEGFTLTVREVRLSAGAGFIIPITGTIMTMPGLPKRPAACSIDVDDKGLVTGLF
jgi:formate--tetrahydrofolate ligase